MLKKLILVTALLAASSAALANGAPYVGASAGVNTDVFNFNASNDSISLGGRGAIGNIFAGYGAMVSQSFYLGGEVFADATNTSSDSTVNYVVSGTTFSETSKIKERYGYGISIIPGLALSDHTMAFARVGVVRSNFKFEASNPYASASEEENLTGAQFGLGMQTSVTQNIDFRGEYVFTAYKTGSYDMQPRSDQFNIGLIYKFE